MGTGHWETSCLYGERLARVAGGRKEEKPSYRSSHRKHILRSQMLNELGGGWCFIIVPEWVAGTGAGGCGGEQSRQQLSSITKPCERARDGSDQQCCVICLAKASSFRRVVWSLSFEVRLSCRQRRCRLCLHLCLKGLLRLQSHQRRILLHHRLSPASAKARRESRIENAKKSGVKGTPRISRVAPCHRKRSSVVRGKEANAVARLTRAGAHHFDPRGGLPIAPACACACAVHTGWKGESGGAEDGPVRVAAWKPGGSGQRRCADAIAVFQNMLRQVGCPHRFLTCASASCCPRSCCGVAVEASACCFALASCSAFF